MARWVQPRMLRTVRRAVWVAALCATARADVPATMPSTSPASIPTSITTEPIAAKGRPAPPFPNEYGVLMTRSIFARRRGPGPGGPDAAAIAQMSRDSGFVLRGVADQAGQRTALLEDTTSGKTRQLHVGDETSGGRVVAITMEGLDRSLGGQVLHVGVGQSLDGKVEAAGPTTRQSIAREDGAPPVAPEPAPGTAIPAGARILEIKQ